ncbi:hypothetical protein ACRALDRAFT_1077448 [Sodiomyces alcalophilus JCM 7366]|uniref:uncharacterized protein n=1 Tax=Sodiomyces alcalophilus JCM 7366 TaxID=591952 RepID=UPI0039B65660
MSESLPPLTADNPETSSEFIGWFLNPTSTEPISCRHGEHLQTSSRFAACCVDGPCAMPTRCSANVLTYDDSYTIDCGPDHSCVTMTLYQTMGSEGEPTANIMCGISTRSFCRRKESRWDQNADVR